MTDVHYIRQEVNLKGRPYAAVANQMQVDERTVKKYADKDDWNESKQKQQRKARVMESVIPILDKWLAEDANKKKKFRRTAKRMFEQLKKDYNFEGSDRSVRAYVSRRKRELAEASEAALPLEAKPGTAQVDFGEAPFLFEGKVIELPFLVLSFPYSNAFYFQVFRSQNRESFLEGLARIFQHIGGVPKAIRFDNLAPAVKKVLPHGERELTDEFQNFVLHYGFDPEFCNPASGNEKGHVEAMVKYVRNNFLLPELTFVDLERLNQTFWQSAEQDRKRDHYIKEEPISVLYEHDQNALFQLPEKRYECVRYETVRADKYGYVRVDNRFYSSSPRFAKTEVSVRITYDRVEILTAQQEVIVHHTRLYGEQKQSMNWQPYLTLMAKRPMAIKYTSFYEQLPQKWQDYLEACTVGEKQQALRLLSVLLKDQELSVATQALEQASKSGHPSAESIKQIFYQLVNGRGHRKEIDVQRAPLMPAAVRGANHYDQLFKKGDVS